LGRVKTTITLAMVGLAAAGVATAEATTVALDPVKPCYLAGEDVGLSGTGYTASGTVSFAVDGQTIFTEVADTAGNFATGLHFGQMKAVKTHTLTATDATNPAVTASLNFVGTTQQVATRDSRGKPGQKKKLRGYGFIFGKKAYMHVRGHGIKSNKFLKRVTAPCGTFTVRKAFVPSSAPIGKYRVQFDHKKAYKKNRPGAIAYELTVFRTFNSTEFGGGGWSLAPISR
jgi:hypothetical protein